MKTVIFLLTSAILLASCGSKDEGNQPSCVNGTLTNVKGGEMLYLEEISPLGKNLIDSVAVDEKGNFKFKGFKVAPSFYRVKVDEANFGMLVLDSTQNATLTGDFKDLGNTYKVEGSPDTKVFLLLNDLGRGISTRMDSFNTAFQTAMESIQDSIKKDSVFKNVYKPAGEKLMNEHQIKVSKIVTEHSNSLAALAGLQALDPDHYLNVYTAVYNGIKGRYPSSKYLFTLKQNIDSFKKTKGGATAPDFTANTPDGKTLSLSFFKGQVVLIDFWASWCSPCRAENPNVVRVYNKYHSKGFEILGVSLDENKNKWNQAIEKDHLIWKHVSDLKGWASDIAKLYGVETIPFSVLVDKDGNILAKGLRGEELDKKLSEIFR